MTVPEIWKPVPGMELRYEASNHGRVRSLDRTVTTSGGRTAIVKGRVLKPVLSRTGLGTVTCGTQRYGVHILIATLFVERPPGARYVRHRNGDRSDNSAANLQWITDAGRLSPSDDQIAQVLAMHRYFRMSQQDMVTRSGLSLWQVSQIIRQAKSTRHQNTHSPSRPLETHQ